jgi:hypothetical protein
MKERALFSTTMTYRHAAEPAATTKEAKEKVASILSVKRNAMQMHRSNPRSNALVAISVNDPKTMVMPIISTPLRTAPQSQSQLKSQSIPGTRSTLASPHGSSCSQDRNHQNDLTSR